MAQCADTDSILKDIDEGLECPICLETFANPRSLKCDHTFCLLCLDKMVKGDPKRACRFVVCPECRDETIFHGIESAGDLKRPLQLQKLLRIKESIESSQLQPPIKTPDDSTPKSRNRDCELCKWKNIKTKARSLCMQCDTYFCDECSIQHTNTGEGSTHDIIPLLSEDKIHTCVIHDKTCSRYCSSCKELVCALCIMITHKDHRTDEISCAAKNLRERLRDNVYNFQQQAKNPSEATMEQMCRNAERVIDAAQVKVEEDILLKSTEVLRNFKERLDEATASLIKEVDAHTMEQKDRLKTIKGKCADAATRNVTEMDELFLEIQNQYENDLDVLKSEVEIGSRINAASQRTTKIHMDFRLASLLGERQETGDINIGAIAFKSKLSLDANVCVFYKEPLTFQCQTIGPPFEYGKIGNMKKKLHVKTKGELMGLVLSPESREILLTSVVDKNGQLDRHSYVNGQKVGPIPAGLPRPSGLCRTKIDDKMCFAVVCQEKNVIQTFNSKGKLIDSMTSDRFARLLDICYISKSNLYAVTDRDANCVHIVDLDFKQIVSTLTSATHDAWKPQYIASYKDNLAISDVVDGSITVLNVYGGQLKTYQWLPFQPGKLCYDKWGNLLVCDVFNNTLVCCYDHRPDDCVQILDLDNYGKPYLLDVDENTFGIGIEREERNLTDVYVFENVQEKKKMIR